MKKNLLLAIGMGCRFILSNPRSARGAVVPYLDVAVCCYSSVVKAKSSLRQGGCVSSKTGLENTKDQKWDRLTCMQWGLRYTAVKNLQQKTVLAQLGSGPLVVKAVLLKQNPHLAKGAVLAQRSSKCIL